MTNISNNDSTGPTGLDDLTRIKGIGEFTRQWLQEEFGIRSFSDLATMSVDDIEERLKAEGKITARSRIEGWLAQAQELAEAAPAPARPAAPAPPQKDDWKTVTTFVVMFEEREVDEEPQFQTKAHHMEADLTRIWPGIIDRELAQWMIAQLDPRMQAAPSPAPEPVSQTLQPEAAAPRFSGKLGQYVARVQELMADRDRASTSSARTASSTMASQSQVDQTAENETQTDPSLSEYSSALQQVIEKARRLAESAS